MSKMFSFTSSTSHTTYQFNAKSIPFVQGCIILLYTLDSCNRRYKFDQSNENQEITSPRKHIFTNCRFGCNQSDPVIATTWLWNVATTALEDSPYDKRNYFINHRFMYDHVTTKCCNNTILEGLQSFRHEGHSGCKWKKNEQNNIV